MTRLSHAEMTHEIGKLCYGKVDWLHRFSSGKNKRSDPEIDLKRRELVVLQQAKEDYAKAAAKANAA